MYIACPECDTKFVVTAEQIGAQGRKVKCSKCGNVWHQKLENNLRIEPSITPVTIEATPLGNGVNLPALVPIKISPFLYGMPVILIGMIIFMSINLFPNVFRMSSILNNENLSIKDLQITNDKELNKITVAYKVLNSGKKTVKMPLVRIRLFDKNNRVIKTLIDDRSMTMTPSQNISLKAEFIPAPANTENIEIMLGNKLDFFLW